MVILFLVNILTHGWFIACRQSTNSWSREKNVRKILVFYFFDRRRRRKRKNCQPSVVQSKRSVELFCFFLKNDPTNVLLLPWPAARQAGRQVGRQVVRSPGLAWLSLWDSALSTCQRWQGISGWLIKLTGKFWLTRVGLGMSTRRKSIPSCRGRK